MSMNHSHFGWALCSAVLGCSAGSHTAAPSPSEDGPGGTGARIEGLTLWEERDGTPSLRLTARAADFQPASRRATLHDLELRFDLPAQGVTGGVLTAKRGHLDQAQRLLSLEDSIALRDAQGRTLTAARARYLFDPRRLDIPGPALARSAQGTARAGRAAADFAAESLVLEGGVDAELIP